MHAIQNITELISRRFNNHRFNSRRFNHRRLIQGVVTVIVAFIVIHRLVPGVDPVRVVRRTFEDKSASLVELGIRSLQQQTPDGAKTAITYFDKALETDPQNPEIYYNRALAWYALKNANQSMADLGKAIEVDPEYALAYYKMGVIYQLHGHQEDAVANYSKAIELTPDFWEAIQMRAVLHEEMQRLDESIADYNQLVKVLPANPSPELAYSIHCRRAGVYMAKNMVREAIVSYNAAIDADPYNAHIIRSMLSSFPQQIEAIDPASETFAEYEALLRRIDETWESNHE